jgi:hypothetical protein
MKPRRPYGTLTNAAREMVARPAGVGAAELAAASDAPTHDASSLLCRMVRRGEAVQVPVPGSKCGQTRFFVSQELADAWIAVAPSNPVEEPRRLNAEHRRILALVKDQGSMMTRDLARIFGKSNMQMSDMARRLCRRGLLFSRGRRSNLLVFFSTQADADAWIEPPKPSRQEKQERMGKTQRAVLAAVHEAAAEGLSAREFAALQGISIPAASHVMHRMADASKLTRVMVGTAGRFFADALRARDWSAAVAAAAARKQPAPKPRAAGAFAVASEKPSIAPSVTVKNHGRVAPAGEAIVPAHVKPVVCPPYTHNHRYQVAPDWKPAPGGFAAAGLGRYLEA